MKKVFLLFMLIYISAAGYQLGAMSPDSLSHIELEEGY
jgi:iron complex outermembrane receptor protein